MSDNKTSESREKELPQPLDWATALNRVLDVFWKYGYGSSTLILLSKAMQVSPPSLYANFGSKAGLFLEAITHYEQNFWREPARSFWNEPDVYKAVTDFFEKTARALVTPEVSCSSMIVAAALNIDEKEKDIIRRVLIIRQATLQLFIGRLERARVEGQLPEDCDTQALTSGLNAFLESLALQARDGMTLDELLSVARLAVSLLPPPRA